MTRHFVTRRRRGLPFDDPATIGYDEWENGRPTGRVVASWSCADGEMSVLYIEPQSDADRQAMYREAFDMPPEGAGPDWRNDPLENTPPVYRDRPLGATQEPAVAPLAPSASIVHRSDILAHSEPAVPPSAPQGDIVEDGLAGLPPDLHAQIKSVGGRLAAMARQFDAPTEDRYYVSYDWHYGSDRYPIAHPGEAAAARTRLEAAFRGMDFRNWQIIHERVSTKDLGWPETT